MAGRAAKGDGRIQLLRAPWQIHEAMVAMFAAERGGAPRGI
jgi:hypothetical protein